MTDEPTDPAVEPHAAVVELIHRHSGPKKPYTGNESIIFPNHLRIDGVAVFATYDNPAVLQDVRIEGDAMSPFLVTLQLLARALTIGGTPAFDPDAVSGQGTSAAVIEIPDVDTMAPGEELQRPYVLLNGNPVYLYGGVGIGEMATHGEGWTAATVTITLPVRKLVVDDETTDES